MKELAKHIIREVLEYTLKYKTTGRQRTEHAKRLIQQNIDSKLAVGTLNKGIEEAQYRLDLLRAVNDNDKEVVQEEIAKIEERIKDDSSTIHTSKSS